MLDWFYRWKERKARIRVEADILMAAHGEGAWCIAYARCRDMTLAEADREKSLVVLREIEHRRGIKRQPDTATRYLTQ